MTKDFQQLTGCKFHLGRVLEDLVLFSLLTIEACIVNYGRQDINAEYDPDLPCYHL